MVTMLAKKNTGFLILWVIVFYGSEAVEISKINDFCENDSCLNNSQSSSGVKPDFNVKEIGNLSEKEIYFVATTEVPLNVSSDKNISFQKFQETTSNLQVNFTEIAEENNQSTVNLDQLLNTTEMTVVSEFTTEHNLTTMTTTTLPNITKTVSTSKAKLNISTTPTPFYAFVAQNTKKSKKICFCDIQTNQCDINCCCDEDCTLSHFKVFTKCYDDDYAMYDPKYCYSTIFIFGNNTSNQIIKNNGGLFCIVRENLKSGFDYEAKPLLTTLEAFNKSLQNSLYRFFHKLPEKLEFDSKNYLAGSPVWSVYDKELVPFKISHSSVGLLCNSEVNIKFLIDEVKTCFYQHQPEIRCEGSKIGNVLHYLSEVKIISSPTFLNKSQLVNSSEICRESTCIGITSYLCETVDSSSDCTKILKKSKDASQMSCWSTLSHIQYQIWHNGSEGIIKMEAYLWVKKLPRLSEEFLSQTVTEVQYFWISSTKKVFRRSGNPGYLTGKPILAGRKIYNIVNGTGGKKEAIELSIDPKNWLSVLGSEKGICSSKERIPINFRENGQFMCSLKLSKSNFSKEKCMELQSNIFKLLIGNEIINETKENYFNKFVATFGNSRVEETGDWVQVLIDLFPISTSPVSFKSNHRHLMCKNVITDLHIDIIYSKIGSFLAPQSKILGVSFQFGKHKDFIYYCDTSGCENTSRVQHFKLSTAIRFVDITKKAVDAFAEPLRLETKLPHDFFYPFFSKSNRSQFLNDFLFILFLFVCFFNVAHGIARI